MAVNKEFLTSVFEGIEKPEERIEKVLKEYEADITGLKVNRDTVLSESKGYKEKLEKLAAEYGTEKSGFQKRIEELETKIKSSGSDETKAFYEAEKQKVEDMWKVKLTDAEKLAKQHETALSEIRQKHTGLIIDTEIDRALDKIQSLDRAKANMLRDLIKTRNQFIPTPVEGEEKMLSKDYKSIADTINAFIATEEGKFFLISNSTGGGAPGSTGTKPSIHNPYKKETFNLTEQIMLEKENPAQAAILKAAAGKS